MSPIVSVIIPSYNHGIYIKKAIDSVLEQEIACEIIIIDDASDDNTYDLVKPYISNRVQYIKNIKNMGVAASRNIGIEQAKGKYIAFLDSDDWWKKGKLKAQVKVLEQNKGFLSYTARELFSENSKLNHKIISVPNEVSYSQLLKTNFIACSSVVVRTEIAKKVRMEHDEFHEDYLMWLKILKQYGGAYGVNYPYLNTRLTINGKSRDKRKTFRMTYGVYRCLGINKVVALYYVINHIIRSVFRYFL